MINIYTYKELEDYMNAFSTKHLNLLIILSKGGLGKTMLAEETLITEAPLIFTGHVTPMGMYRELYNRNQEEKDFICVYDDVDSLMVNKTNVALLKQVCDTKEEKTIKYFTTSPNLGDIPSEFRTKCKVLMLINDIKTDDKNLSALLTRAHIIDFTPSNKEITKYAERFSNDPEIVKYIDKFSSFSKNLNLRVYKKASELKKANLNWKKEVLNMLSVDQNLINIAELLEKYKTDKEREEHFEGSRSSFYRYKKLFLAKSK